MRDVYILGVHTVDRNLHSTTNRYETERVNKRITKINIDNGKEIAVIEEDELIIFSIDLKPQTCREFDSSNNKSTILNIDIDDKNMLGSIGKMLNLDIYKISLLCINYENTKDLIDLKVFMYKNKLEDTDIERVATNIAKKINEILGMIRKS